MISWHRTSRFSWFLRNSDYGSSHKWAILNVPHCNTHCNTPFRIWTYKPIVDKVAQNLEILSKNSQNLEILSKNCVSVPTFYPLELRWVASHLITGYRLFYGSLLQNIVSFIGLFCKRDLYFWGAYESSSYYGVPTIRRLLQMIGLFC